MNPVELLSDPAYEIRFKKLLRENMTFVDDWDDPKITPDVQRMYARRMPAYEASSKYVESCQRGFEINGTPFTVSEAEDWQRVADTRGDFTRTISDAVRAAVNHGVKEPRKLLFWSGAQFEATLNGEGFNQSQLLIMLEVPTANMIMLKTPISLLAAPAGVNYIDVSNGIPSYNELVAAKWRPVKVGHAPDRPITHRGMVGCRHQYALRHVGSGTINKQLGNTIEGKCAMECNKDGSPWEKAQGVVGLS